MGSGTSTVGMEVFGNADGTRYHPHSRRRDASYLARWKLVFFPVCSSNRQPDLLALGILLAVFHLPGSVCALLSVFTRDPFRKAKPSSL